MQMKTFIRNGLSGERAKHEDVEYAQHQADERQDQTKEQEARQRVLTAETGDLQLVERRFVDECPAQVEPLDDVAHTDRLLLAQALVAAVGFGGKAHALLGAQLVALKGNRLHAPLERISAQGRQDGEHSREHRDRDEQRDEEGRIGKRFNNLVRHRPRPRSSSSCASQRCRSPSTRLKCRG
jgi:hypothetical protein